jgi:hypothetical protein
LTNSPSSSSSTGCSFEKDKRLAPPRPHKKKTPFQKSGRAGWNGIFTFHPLIGSAILPHAAVGNRVEGTHKHDVQAEAKLCGTFDTFTK